MNDSAVMTQVNHIKHRPNLLLWYTADEPDGTSDPLDATLKASNVFSMILTSINFGFYFLTKATTPVAQT